MLLEKSGEIVPERMKRLKWQWKHDNSKPKGCSKSSSKREVYSTIILPQETRKTLNRQPNFTPKTTAKRRTKPPKISRRKEIINIWAETNDNENMTTQKLWDAAKAVQRGKFIAKQSYLKKQEKHWIDNLALHLKQLGKEEQRILKDSRRKEIIKLSSRNKWKRNGRNNSKD